MTSRISITLITSFTEALKVSMTTQISENLPQLADAKPLLRPLTVQNLETQIQAEISWKPMRHYIVIDA